MKQLISLDNFTSKAIEAYCNSTGLAVSDFIKQAVERELMAKEPYKHQRLTVMVQTNGASELDHSAKAILRVFKRHTKQKAGKRGRPNKHLCIEGARALAKILVGYTTVRDAVANTSITAVSFANCMRRWERTGLLAKCRKAIAQIKG